MFELRFNLVIEFEFGDGLVMWVSLLGAMPRKVKFGVDHDDDDEYDMYDYDDDYDDQYDYEDESPGVQQKG